MTAALAFRRAGTGLRSNAAFRRLWLGESVSALGASVSSVALPLLALGALHAGLVEVGVLGAMAWIPWLVIGLPAGAWVDRLPLRPVMMSCDALALGALLSVPVVAWCGGLTLTQLYVVATAVGTAQVFFSTAYRALLPAVVADEHLDDANARLIAAESGATVAGPGVAGALTQTLGAVTGVLADALSYLVSLVCLRGLRVPETRAIAPRRPLRTEIASGLRFLVTDRLLRLFVATGCLANLALAGFGDMTVPFLVRTVRTSPAEAGVLLALGQIGGVVGAATVPRLVRRWGSARALLIAKVGTAPIALLVPLAAAGPRLALFVVGSLGLVAGVMAGNVVSRTFTQRYCPPELLGRVTTAMQLVNYGAIPLGAVLGGVLADALGLRPALGVLLAVFVASTALLAASPLRRLRDLPTAADRAPDLS